jgi:hypothetical protein
MRRTPVVLLALLLLLSVAAGAQQAAIGFCALDQTLDFKTAKAGDKIALHLTRDLVVNGKTLMLRGVALTATVADAKNGNALSIVLDKATPKPGQDVPLMGIIAAVAAPPNDLTGDAFYSMNRSNEPTQRGQRGGSGSIASSDSSSTSSGAAVRTAQMKGANEPKSNLQEDSSGAIGIDGLKLNWVLDKPPATTVMTAKKNLKLPSGTEVLLRMAPPQM